MIPRGKDVDFGSRLCEMVSHKCISGHVHNILKPMISKTYLLQFVSHAVLTKDAVPSIHSQKAAVLAMILAVQICVQRKRDQNHP